MAISLVLIVARLLCTFGASLFTRFMSHFITVADPNPGWKGPIIFGWAGMRGVVSLAAALSIPLLIKGGQAFPSSQSYSLYYIYCDPGNIGFTGINTSVGDPESKLEDNSNLIPRTKTGDHHSKENGAYTRLQYLDEKYDKQLPQNEHLNNLHERLKIDMKFLNQELENTDNTNENSLENFQRIYLEMLEHQRKLLTEMNHRAEFDEELIRKYLSLIDLEEFKDPGKTNTAINEKAIRYLPYGLNGRRQNYFRKLGKREEKEKTFTTSMKNVMQTLIARPGCVAESPWKRILQMEKNRSL